MSELDRDIELAYRRLSMARLRFEESPTGELVTLCEECERVLNELLDSRFASTHPVLVSA